MTTLSARPVPAAWPSVPRETPPHHVRGRVRRLRPAGRAARRHGGRPGGGARRGPRAGRGGVRRALPRRLPARGPAPRQAGAAPRARRGARGHGRRARPRTWTGSPSASTWPSGRSSGAGGCAACAEGSKEACPGLRIAGVHPRGLRRVHRGRRGAVWSMPDDLDPATAAGVALAGPVAMNQLRQAGLRRGDWVLVVGAASALGVDHRRARPPPRRAGHRHLPRGLEARAAPRDRARGRARPHRRRLRRRGPRPHRRGRCRRRGRRPRGPRDFAGLTDVLAPRGALVSSGAFLGGTVPLDLARLYTLNQRILGSAPATTPAGARSGRRSRAASGPSSTGRSPSAGGRGPPLPRGRRRHGPDRADHGPGLSPSRAGEDACARRRGCSSPTTRVTRRSPRSASVPVG